MPTTLDKIYGSKNAKVIDIQGGQTVRQRLSQMGIHPGDTVTILRYGALHGPLLIEVHGSQVALGRGIAARVIVEEMG
jgi:ferrous iron transport protein A